MFRVKPIPRTLNNMRSSSLDNISSIATHGFLSEEADAYRERFRTTYANQLSTCEEKSHAATAQLFNADLSALNLVVQQHVVIGLGLWLRCLRACQAALILVERGMIPEAQTQTRSAYEFLFYAAALISDPDVMSDMELGDSYARKEQAKAMLIEGQKAGMWSTEHIAILNEIVAEHGKGRKQLSAYDAAKKAGMEFLHATVYRGMSFIGAHATAAATDSVFEVRGEKIVPVFGPSDTGLEFCVGLIDTCLTEGTARFSPLLPPA